MGLDTAIKDMKETEACLSGALKRFYEITHGRKPSKGDVEKLLEKSEKTVDTEPEQDCSKSSLDFFDTQNKKEEVEPEKSPEIKEEGEEPSEEEMVDFWELPEEDKE
jgi:hypothetical protein